MRETEFYLNWNKDVLMSFENKKDALVVAAMIEGIKLGHKFPAVDVVRGNYDNVYELAWGDRDDYENWLLNGGHNRSLAHYIEGVPLLCNLLSKHRGTPPSSFERELKNVILREGLVADYQIKSALKHLPRDVAEKFCCENDLDSTRYLSQ